MHKYTILVPVLVALTLIDLSSGASLYDFKVNDIKGNPVDMAQYKGKVRV